jgi:hypothetical protein
VEGGMASQRTEAEEMTRKPKPHVWVIESNARGKWEVADFTIHVSTTKRDARMRKYFEYGLGTPGLRVAKYVREK